MHICDAITAQLKFCKQHTMNMFLNGYTASEMTQVVIQLNSQTTAMEYCSWQWHTTTDQPITLSAIGLGPNLGYCTRNPILDMAKDSPSLQKELPGNTDHPISGRVQTHPYPGLATIKQ